MQTLKDYVNRYHNGSKQKAAEALGVTRMTVANQWKHGRVENHNLYTCKRLNQGVTK